MSLWRRKEKTALQHGTSSLRETTFHLHAEEKLLNGVEECGAGWQELHQHPVVGHRPPPNDVGATGTDIVPNFQRKSWVTWEQFTNSEQI